jgi:hypothetical protein
MCARNTNASNLREKKTNSYKRLIVVRRLVDVASGALALGGEIARRLSVMQVLLIACRAVRELLLLLMLLMLLMRQVDAAARLRSAERRIADPAAFVGAVARLASSLHRRLLLLLLLLLLHRTVSNDRTRL